MSGETAKRLRSLYEQLAVEKNVDKLLKLAQEINHLLDEKEQPLRQQQSTDSQDNAA